MKILYVDIGSSTVKVYEVNGGHVKQVETKSFQFKQDFDPKVGLTETATEALIDYLCSIRSRYPDAVIRLIATALFRKLAPAARQALVDRVFRQTGLFLNVISQELESYYLEQALSAEYRSNAPVLLINIGGGSTELIIREGGQTTNRLNFDIGVGSVLRAFPGLNEDKSIHSLREVVDHVRRLLPPTDMKLPSAIYNGGELTYMRLVGYQLQPNTLFEDDQHPSLITARDFAAKNEEVFAQITLTELEALMPQDPLWMHGARACSAIAQAIIEHFGVDQLVPSDSNTVHGVVRQELRSVVLSGSFRKHLTQIGDVRRQLSAKNVQILSPRFVEPKNPGGELAIFDGEEGLSPLELERYHLDMIDRADALIVCAVDGYVGASTLIEIGYAQKQGKRIIFTEEPKEFMLKTLPSEVGIA